MFKHTWLIFVNKGLGVRGSVGVGSWVLVSDHPESESCLCLYKLCDFSK